MVLGLLLSANYSVLDVDYLFVAIVVLLFGDSVQAGELIGISDGSGVGPPYTHQTHRPGPGEPKVDPLTLYPEAVPCK